MKFKVEKIDVPIDSEYQTTWPVLITLTPTGFQLSTKIDRRSRYGWIMFQKLLNLPCHMQRIAASCAWDLVVTKRQALLSCYL